MTAGYALCHGPSLLDGASRAQSRSPPLRLSHRVVVQHVARRSVERTAAPRHFSADYSRESGNGRHLPGSRLSRNSVLWTDDRELPFTVSIVALDGPWRV